MAKCQHLRPTSPHLTPSRTHPPSRRTLHPPFIFTELSAASGAPVDLGGWFMPDERKAELAMRPSKTLNGIIGSIIQDAEEELVA